jgi:serine/threonine protein kinase
MAGTAQNLDREEQLNEILLTYVESEEAGRAPNRAELLYKHPEFAEELSEFFDSRDQMERLAAPIRTAVRPGQMWTESGGFVSLPFPTSDKALGQLGDFQLLREIGRGGMGIVYEAVQISLNRPVALKVLPFAAALDPKQLQRFKHEAQASALLHHTNIVPVHAVGCERGVHYYAMQLINGQSLAAMIAEMRRQSALRPTHGEPDSAAGDHTGPYTPEPASSEAPAAELPTQPIGALSTVPTARGRHFYRSAADLARKAAEALEHAHGLGVVHRDIKPANLLVDVTGNLWITDFGLALFQSDMGLTMTGEILGTLRYMSPEQAMAKRGLVDHRTDIYSLGVTLYELLTLQPAITGRDRQELMHQIALEEPRAPRRLERNIPVELETIVLKAIAKTPAERYATAQEFADDLQRFLDDKPVMAKRPSLLDKTTKWAKRHKSLVASAAALVIITAAVASAFSIRLAQVNFQLGEEEAKTKKALGNEQREAELAKEQRDLAESRFRQSRNAVDFFAQIAEDLPDLPNLQPFRRRMMEEALGYYKSFIDEHQDDPKLKAELAESYARVAKILDGLGKKTDALASADRARAINEQLSRTHPADVDAQRRLFMTRQHLFSMQGCSQLGLLAQKAVRDELQITDDQFRQVEGLSDVLSKQRQHLREFPPLTEEDQKEEFERLGRENKERVARILRAEQAARLVQISLQVRGSRAFRDKEVAERLELTAEQREKIEEILRDSWSGPGRRKSDEPRKRAIDRILAELTDAQRIKWNELIGPPVKDDIRLGPPEWEMPARKSR